MTRRAAVLPWLVTLLLLPPSAFSQENAPTRAVRGRVVDARTGEPVPEARIRVLAPRVEETVTDRAGAFELELLAQPVELEASRQGYEPQRITVAISDTVITVSLQPH